MGWNNRKITEPLIVFVQEFLNSVIEDDSRYFFLLYIEVIVMLTTSREKTTRSDSDNIFLGNHIFLQFLLGQFKFSNVPNHDK